jgi:hypothetical protein
MFRQIFRAPSEKQRLLADVIPEFFVLFQKALLRTIFLEFRLLTEKPETMGRRNASLPGLLEALHGATWTSTAAARHIEAVKMNSTVRTHVNRIIAHIDWNTAVGVEPPPAAVRLDDIEDALANVRAVMQHLATELKVPELDYTNSRIDHDVAKLFATLASLQEQ